MKFSLGAVLALAATAIASPMDIEARARSFLSYPVTLHRVG